MVHRSVLLLALAGFGSLIQAAVPGDYGSGGYGDPSPSPSSAAPANPTPAASSAGGVNGDVTCGPLMCVGAIVKSDSIEYVVQSVGSRPVGWMSMGFGTSMVKSPLVVIWPNSDGSITLSQRMAVSRSLPAVDPNPPRIATLNKDLSSASGNQPKFAYTISNDGDTKPKIIYAFGVDTPTSSNASSAIFTQHISYGRLTLDLTRSGLNATVLSSPALSLVTSEVLGSSKPSQFGSSSRHKTEMIILAHGVILAIAFLLVMPAGALLARFYRTFSVRWFKWHWILQFAIAAPLVLAGAILGFTIGHVGGPSTSNTHTQIGVLLLVLYFLQASLGSVIHFFKPKSSIFSFKGRSLQNYAHAVLGLLVIGLAFFQVHTGYAHEWPNAVGRKAPGGVDVFWYIWIVVLPASYTLGLLFLKKQYRQEREMKVAMPRQMSWEKKRSFA